MITCLFSFVTAVICGFVPDGFLAFGLWHFEGVKRGTVLCALINGWIIGRFSAFYEKYWSFYDRFGWRKFFE